MSVDQKAPSAVFHLAGALAPALHQPPDIKAGNQRGQLGIVQMLPLAGELEKAVVGPDDVVALRAEEHHGQRGVDHSVLGCGLHIAGVAVQTFVDLPRLRRDASRLYRPRQATTASSTPASGQEKAADSRAKTIRHRKYSRKLG